MMRFEYCRQAFETSCLRYQGDLLTTSLSAGVASLPMHGETANEVLDAADKAVYLAKQDGRKRVSLL